MGQRDFAASFQAGVLAARFQTHVLFAKQARGSMARFMITNRVKVPEGLKAFGTNGYEYRDDLSDEQQWVFTRPQPAPPK